MAQAKENIARWVLQGISVLGILLGVGWVYVAITMPFMIHREDSDSLWFELPFFGLILVIGAWLARDCYLMLRWRSFGAIKSISALLALMFMGSFDRWLMSPETASEGENRLVRDLLAVASLLSVVLVYFGCKKLLTRLLKAARGPEEPAETPHPAG